MRLFSRNTMQLKLGAPEWQENRSIWGKSAENDYFLQNNDLISHTACSAVGLRADLGVRTNAVVPLAERQITMMTG